MKEEREPTNKSGENMLMKVEREGERVRERDRQTDRQRQRDRDRGRVTERE